MTPVYPGAMVGLEQTFISVSEGVGSVELCVNILYPIIDCPVMFPFNVTLLTLDLTAGGQ